MSFNYNRNAKDPDVRSLQESVRRAFQLIFQSALSLFLGARLIEDQTLNASAVTYVEHGLGRRCRIWIICDIDSQCMILRDEASERTRGETEYLALTASGGVAPVVSILVA